MVATEPDFTHSPIAADVPAEVLDPRASWANKKAYDENARGLTRDFERDFSKYERDVSDAISRTSRLWGCYSRFAQPDTPTTGGADRTLID